MSADNYLFVGKTADGKYGVEMRFASADYSRPISKPNADLFSTAQEALAHAWNLEREEFCEYGVVVDRQVQREITRASSSVSEEVR